MTRRDAARHLLHFAAASPLLRAQERAPRLEDMINVLDFDAACRRTIPREAYDFVSGAADDEWTMQRNRDAFRRITFRPRMLVDVSRLDCSLELFGQRIEMPVLVAPTGTQGRVHPGGEPAMARAAGAAKTIMVVSTTSSYPIEKIAQEATGPLWFQLYAGPDEEGTREKVERAVAAGCKAVCLTVDAPYFPHRERDLRNGLVRAEVQSELRTRRRREGAPPDRYGLPSRFTAQLTWAFVDRLRTYAKVPVLIKGILTPDDAKLAVEHGASGVIVSNHGGRYLDGDPATIEVLPGIVDAAGGRIPVLVDGGFRRGTDVLKALALGARAVLVGRPPLWGLGAFGTAGAQRVLEMLQTELALAMALAGRPNLGAIDRSLVQVDRGEG
jgi:isopentenyl diphosphate isomerase/L-lactate dehydrogenase-like FMN-dependent dehydrogenase